MSLSRSLPGSSRSSANALVMPRYASRSSTSRHHCAVTDDDGHGARRGERSKIESLPKWRPISTDALFGRHRAKDAEILVLRHQIVVLERHLHGEKIRFTSADRALLAALLHRLPRDMLRRIRLLVRPETVLRWPAT
jgi:hypothetical protein